jgi:hypothetical protein
MHKPMRVASGHLLRHQEWGDPTKVANRDARSQEEVIVMSHIALHISLKDSPNSKEEDNRGRHPTTGETTSLSGAPTPIVFTPTN